MSKDDPNRLQRFVDAQERCIEQVYRELRAGLKESHWIWFIFPQLKGLGSSPTANLYGISSAAEAGAYLRHPVLGERLRHCTNLVLALEGRSAHDVFGADDVKFRSSMTLFAHVDSQGSLFGLALGKYFEGKPDPLTVNRL
jgi:uncharacterized protein (DUF1810 family)